MRAAERNDEAQARALVRDLVLALQAALLVKHAPPAVADAFCASRLAGEGGAAFGTLPRGLRPARDRRARRAAILSYSFPNIASTSATCARKPTVKASVRSTGHAERVDDGVRQPRPEIDRAGDHGGFRSNGRMASRISTSGAKITRFSTALVCAK